MNTKTDAGRNIYIVDDHPIVRQGLAQLINGTGEYHVCGDSDNPAQALREVEQLKPALVIVDLSLGGRSGFELLEDLRRANRNQYVLVLSMYEEAGYAERALKLGSRGYVMKKEATEKIIEAIGKILHGDVYVSDEIKDKLVNRLVNPPSSGSPSPVDVLSNRELEVLELLGRGLKPRIIAERLKLSVKTIETYCEHLKQKLHITNAAELSTYATTWLSSSALKGP